MNRRGFLQLLGLGAGAIAAEQVIPFNRVWSFPKQIVMPGSLVIPPLGSVRFIKAYDPAENRMMHRFDMLYGFGNLAIPVPAQQFESANQWHNASDKPTVWRAPEYIPSVAVAKVREMADSRAHLGDRQIFGVHFNDHLVLA